MAAYGTLTSNSTRGVSNEAAQRAEPVTMGKDDKEETGFGFKDKAKALETLQLLESHDPNYRRLTVRGLLGRAKRVLSLTKAEDKIKNIKEAMEVFEQWLADLDKNKQPDKKKKEDDKRQKEKDKEDSDQDDDSSESSDEEMEERERKKEKSVPPPATPADTVPGLGFKDKEAAESSLKVLEGRDPDYQKLAVKGLIGRAKRVLTCTKDDTKVNNIKEAMERFEKFLDDFDTMHLGKHNNPYLPLGTVLTCLATAQERGVDVTQQKPFIDAYSKVKGEYKKLRTVASDEDAPTWDIVRNKALKPLKDKYSDAKLFNDKDEPTDDHLQLLLWAYSPDAARAKKLIPATDRDRGVERERGDRKRKSSAGDDGTGNKVQKE